MIVDNRKKVLKHIDSEFRKYERNIITKSKKDILCNCSQYDFYKRVYDYFKCNTSIAPKTWKELKRQNNLINALWVLSFQSNMSVESWEKISCLVNSYLGKGSV